MFQLFTNNQTDFLGQIFLESFQFETRSLFLGHPVIVEKVEEINICLFFFAVTPSIRSDIPCQVGRGSFFNFHNNRAAHVLITGLTTRIT